MVFGDLSLKAYNCGARGMCELFYFGVTLIWKVAYVKVFSRLLSLFKHKDIFSGVRKMYGWEADIERDEK